MLPDVEHRVEATPGGGTDLVFPKLVPNEQVTISYLYFPPIVWSQINGQVKSDEGLAKIVHVLPTQQLPPWVIRTMWALIFVGAVALVYSAIYGLRAWLGSGAA